MNLTDLGLLGLFLGTFLAGTIVPFSSDVLYVAIMAAMKEEWLACLVVAVVGNTLGTITTFLLGRAGKTKWVEKYFHVSPEKVEQQQGTVKKYGPFAGLIGWVPVVGKPLLVALGLYKSPTVLTCLMIFLGIAVRFGVWTLALSIG
ncbi:MAG: DedA family protein [Bacteroidales bacterium]|nr:DedA family protein [Bacteroidales bacterium]